MQPNLHNLSREVIFLIEPVFYTAGRTRAMTHAEQILRQKGCRFAKKPDTSVTHLLLGVPSFESDGSLKGGGHLADILPQLRPDVRIYGGKLAHCIPEGYQAVDLLEDPGYVAENARITAYCAVRLAMLELPVTLWRCPVLVIGWGRIGKCLADLLKNMGATISVAVRKQSDHAILTALGYDTLDASALGCALARFRVIFNTAPAEILTKDAQQFCPEDCLKIDLASRLGMDLPGVIWARGLPNKDAPETSGELIARTVLRLR